MMRHSAEAGFFFFARRNRGPGRWWRAELVGRRARFAEVENPGGDPTRRWFGMPGAAGPAPRHGPKEEIHRSRTRRRLGTEGFNTPNFFFFSRSFRGGDQGLWLHAPSTAGHPADQRAGAPSIVARGRAEAGAADRKTIRSRAGSEAGRPAIRLDLETSRFPDD